MENVYFEKNGFDCLVFYRKPSNTWATQIHEHIDEHYLRVYNPVYSIDVFETFNTKENALHFATEYTNKHILV